MGRRSRKRAHAAGASPAEREGSTRAERDLARRQRAERIRDEGPAKAAPRSRPGRTTMDDRPPALWAPFPLSELLILAGLVLMTWGFLSGAEGNGNAKIAAGLGIASLAGLELAVREHVTGFRSHTTMLAGGAAILVIVGLGLGVGLQAFGVLLAAGVVVFAGSFYALRELFRRRSGGLSFR
jgi:anti-sigma factor RsiW